MSWEDLTVPELRLFLTEHNFECPSSLYGRKSKLVSLCENVFSARHLRAAKKRFATSKSPRKRSRTQDKSNEMNSSLAASQAARLQLAASRKSVPSQTPHSRIPVLKPEQEPPVVVKAGRFSIPSEDVTLSSSRRSRKTKRASTKPSRTETASAAPQWPSVDPTGAPVRWKIRDPFVFDVLSSGSSADLSPILTSDSRYSKKKTQEPSTVTVYHKGRIFMFIILIIGISLGMAWPRGIIKSREFIISSLKSFIPPPYCNNDGQPEGCRPCPMHGTCTGSKLTCRRPQYREQKSGGELICVKDQQSYRKAESLLEALGVHLARQQGISTCSGVVPADSVPIETSDGIRSGFTKKQLSGNIPAQESELVILFEELVQLKENQERHGIRKTQVLSQWNDYHEVYYSVLEIKPMGCHVKEFLLSHWLGASTAITLIYLIGKTYQRRRLEARIAKAIKRIITDHTYIKSAEGNKGFAIGPRAYDIRNIICQDETNCMPERDNPQRYPEYAYLKNLLSEAQIQTVCDNIVKADSHFCRSVFAVDMLPFYFSKRVIDNLRIAKESRHNA